MTDPSSKDSSPIDTSSPTTDTSSPTDTSPPDIEYDSATESDSAADDLEVIVIEQDVVAAEEDVYMYDELSYPENQLGLPEYWCWFSCECDPPGSECGARMGMELGLELEPYKPEYRDCGVQVPGESGGALDITVLPSSGEREDTAVEIQIGGGHLINPVFNFNIRLAGAQGEKRAREE